MQAFAALPNVYTKLSGFYESGNQALTPEQYQPYIDTLMQSFTSDKIIWGSNWPMLTLWGSYTEWLNTCKLCLAKYTEQDQKHIFFNNALVFYELVA
jgi:L-fuconolactonase